MKYESTNRRKQGSARSYIEVYLQYNRLPHESDIMNSWSAKPDKRSNYEPKTTYAKYNCPDTKIDFSITFKHLGDPTKQDVPS